jgi:glycosyltransferase involved in cell wall biosynthesis
VISVIIPASNEQGYIGPCLERILMSDDPDSPVQVVVIANGCTDGTVEEAKSLAASFTARGWELDVLELREGSKIAALNAGDRAARYGSRVYVDADIHVSPRLIADLNAVLNVGKPVFASGRPSIRRAHTFVSERYARFWERLPFMAQGVPGCGVYAVNAAARKRWGEFPNVVADDSFVRHHFRDEEMVGVESSYSWPITEGFANLVRVRRRQDAGLNEIRHLYPDLATRMSPTSPTFRQKCQLLFKDPIGFSIYSAVAVAVHLPIFKNKKRWQRGR